MSQRHAEIVGAGFAGLTAACALARRGWSVRVHERAEALRTTGAGIYIYENGLRVLEAVGAYQAAIKGAPFAHTREVRDDQNRTISTHKWQGSRVFSIVRQTVINALAESARTSGVEIVTDSQAVAADSAGEVTLADGRRLKADLVIGADGANSKVRDSLGLMEKRKPLVDGCTRLLIPKTTEEEGQEGATTIEYWSGSRRVLYTPCSPTEVYIALTMLDSDDTAKAVPVDKAAWKRWFPHLDAADRAAGRRRPLRPLRIHPAQTLVGGPGRGDRRRGACAAAEHRPGRRLRDDERAGDGGLSRPGEGRAEGAGDLGAAGASADRAHPAHLADARLADHLAAVHPRQGAGAGREIEVAGASTHEDGVAQADGNVTHSRYSARAIRAALMPGPAAPGGTAIARIAMPPA